MPPSPLFQPLPRLLFPSGWWLPLGSMVTATGPHAQYFHVTFWASGGRNMAWCRLCGLARHRSNKETAMACGYLTPCPVKHWHHVRDITHHSPHTSSTALPPDRTSLWSSARILPLSLQKRTGQTGPYSRMKLRKWVPAWRAECSTIIILQSYRVPEQV